MTNHHGSDRTVSESERLAQEICGHTIDQIVHLIARADEGVSVADIDSRAYWVGRAALELDALDAGVAEAVGDTVEERRPGRAFLVRQLTWELESARPFLSYSS
jgi:hypothetical protein